MAERVVLTPADPAQSARCRGAHNRLGLAYHLAFRRLTGRFPSQHPLELVPDGLALVASELALAPTVLEAYAQRQATVAAPQEPSRLPLGCPAFGPTAREALSQVWREEARPLDHLAALVNAMLALDTPPVWGDGSTASSDGQRLLFSPAGAATDLQPPHGRFRPGVLPVHCRPLRAVLHRPIACTARDAPEVLDGLLYQEADLAPQAHYTDTPGSLALNFAALPMFGKRFGPRIRGLHRQWMYRIDPQKASGPLTPLVSQTKRALHLGWSTAHGDRMGQFFASCAAGQPTASVARKRLRACGPRNPFSRAVRALGRVVKTIGILAYLTVPALRRRGRRGLLKGEQLHA